MRPFFRQRVRGHNNDRISNDEDLIRAENLDSHNCIVFQVIKTCNLLHIFTGTLSV